MNKTVKKILAAQAALMLSFGAVACGQQSNSSATAEMTEYKTTDEASSAAGFDAPGVAEGYEVSKVTAAKDNAIEVELTKDGKTYDMTKSTGSVEDLTGDVSNYTVSHVTINGQGVDLYMDEAGVVQLASWNDGTFSYTIGADGTDRDVIAILVNATL